ERRARRARDATTTERSGCLGDRSRARGVREGAARRGTRVSDLSVIFLGIIALAVTVMASVQVCVIVYGARLARRVDQIALQIDREIKPLLTNLNKVGEEAARAAQLAATQVERVDRLFADVAMRVDDTAQIGRG